MSKLFRPEAIEAQRGSWMGDISVATPLRGWIIALLFAVIAVILVAFLVLGHYTRRQTVIGQLVPTRGLLKVRAQHLGTILQLHVHEGQLVQRGDPLLGISSDIHSLNLGDTRARISQRLRAQHRALAQDRLTQARRAARQQTQLRQQIRLLTTQIGHIDAQLALQRQTIAGDRQLLQRIQLLLLQARGYVSALASSSSATPCAPPKPNSKT